MATRRRADPSRYLVEWYRSALTEEPLEQTAQRLSRSARGMSVDGDGIDLLLTLFVPGDEVAFCLFAADSADSVPRACRRAGLRYERIAEAIEAVARPARRAG